MNEPLNGFGRSVYRIVYCGPSESGKTTNLESLNWLLPDRAVGKLVQLATETNRTLYFDLLTVNLETISRAAGPATLEIFTVPGQNFYHSARRRVLREAHGVVFVADSRRQRLDANIEALSELVAAIQDAGREVDDVPAVLQLNKCDEPSAVPRNELLAALGCEGEPCVEAVAHEGRGVVETLRLITRCAINQSRAVQPVA
ncbi:MAG TPA: GTPase domain-containing protein [Blastocatellia bacterium]|nr:GTPase domain-containing protein [Blastocatellia bacterium]